MPAAEFGFEVWLIQGLKVGSCTMGFAVEDQDRSRLEDAAEIGELIGLTKGLFSWTLGGALQDGHSVADSGEDFSAPVCVFLRRKRGREYGLCDGQYGRQCQEQCYASPDHGVL